MAWERVQDTWGGAVLLGVSSWQVAGGSRAGAGARVSAHAAAVGWQALLPRGCPVFAACRNRLGAPLAGSVASS